MEVTIYKTETIVINEPSQKLLDLAKRMSEHKRIRRESLRNTTPLFTVKA